MLISFGYVKSSSYTGLTILIHTIATPKNNITPANLITPSKCEMLV
jgi:hypothetical protein